MALSRILNFLSEVQNRVPIFNKQSTEDQDTCRICGAPDGLKHPLFHPCKCSGTIRYVHQDCLTTWLMHSKKTVCDVCNHSYGFIAIYPDEPLHKLPRTLLARKLTQYALSGSKFGLRAIAAAIVWFIVLPWVALMIWRTHFYVGEFFAWYVSGLQKPARNTYHPYKPPSVFALISSHPLWLTVSADFFTGQMLVFFIVLSFVATLYARDRVIRSAPPGIFDRATTAPPPIPQQNFRTRVAMQRSLLDENRLLWLQDAAVKNVAKMRADQLNKKIALERQELARLLREALDREAQREAGVIVPPPIPVPPPQQRQVPQGPWKDEEDEDDSGAEEEINLPFWNTRITSWNEIQNAPENPRPVPARNVQHANDLVQLGFDQNGVPILLAGDVEDDTDKFMEAIGLRGPIRGLFQNATLAIIVLSVAIGLAVWLPFVIGKSFALLMLNPRRILHILYLPIKFIQIVTNPVVDLVQTILNEIFMLPDWGSFTRTLGIFPFTSSLQTATSWNVTIRASDKSPFSKHLGYLLSAQSPYPHFGKVVHYAAKLLSTSWYYGTIGSGPAGCVFATTLGYASVWLVLGIYLNLIEKARTTAPTDRNVLRQLFVFKAATLIFIRVVLFPLGCGVVLDLWTIWLIPQTNINSHAAFFSQTPLITIFYHWIAGAILIYLFTALISGCRKIMVPGALWFIDSDYPILDNLDRPILAELQKHYQSAVRYLVVAGCVIGSMASLLQLGCRSILPFRWNNRQSLSDVPVDLVFLLLILPSTMKYFRPNRPIKGLILGVWKYFARRYRLTSYLFSEQRRAEEYTPRRWFGAYDEEPDIRTQHDGQYRRVPATDNLPFRVQIQATARISAYGSPYDKDSEDLMRRQNAEMLKARRDCEREFRIAYIPPNFRNRVYSFIFTLWALGTLALGTSVAIPIALGRGFFRVFTTKEVHDGYSLILGFYIVLACFICGRAIDRLNQLQRHYPIKSRINLILLITKRGSFWLPKVLYMMFTLGVAIPVFVGVVVVDLYIILLVRLTLDPSMPKLRIVDSWAFGVLYIKTAMMYFYKLQPRNRIARGIHQLTLLGWLNPDPISTTKDVIAPVLGGLIGAVLLPGTVFRLIQYLVQCLFPRLITDDKFVFLWAYPITLIAASVYLVNRYLEETIKFVSQKSHDNKGPVATLKLRNYEPEALALRT